MDFKAQIAEDMAVFHNPGEMADLLEVIYNGNSYEVPVIIDHTEATERQKNSADNAQGIFETDAVAYLALSDIGVIPKKDRQIEIGNEATGYTMYKINKSSCEDGEIILELVVLDE